MRRTLAAIFAQRPLQQALLGTFVGAFLGLAPNIAHAAEEPKAQVQGNLDHALRLAIQRAIGVSKSKPATRLDARRRAREAGELAIAVLRSEGYYDYTVEPDVGEGETPTAIVRITLGPRSAMAAPTVVWGGEPPDPDALAAAQKALALTPGAPGRAADVLAAEGRLVSSLRSRGYADVVAKPRQVVVDHADHTLRPTFHIAAGAIAHLGEVKVIGWP